MSDPTTAPASEGRRRALHHQVYVITLKTSVRENRKFMAANPGYAAGKPCVYVGMTGIDPGERFLQHRQGHKDAAIARRFGKGLRRGVLDHGVVLRLALEEGRVLLPRRPTGEYHQGEDDEFPHGSLQAYGPR